MKIATLRRQAFCRALLILLMIFLIPNVSFANVTESFLDLKASEYVEKIDQANARFRAWHALETSNGGNPDTMTPPESIYENLDADVSYDGGMMELTFDLPEFLTSRIAQKLPMEDVDGGGVKLGISASGYRGYGNIGTGGGGVEDDSDYITKSAGGTFESGAALNISGRFAPTSLVTRNLTLTMPDGSLARIGADSLLSGSAFSGIELPRYYNTTTGIFYGDNTRLAGSFNTAFGDTFNISNTGLNVSRLNVSTLETPFGQVTQTGAQFWSSGFSFGGTNSKIEFGENELVLHAPTSVTMSSNLLNLSSMAIESNTLTGTITSTTARIIAPSVSFSGHVYLQGDKTYISEHQAFDEITANRINLGTASITRDGDNLAITSAGNIHLNADSVKVNGKRVLTDDDIVFWPVASYKIAGVSNASATSQGGVSKATYYPGYSTTVQWNQVQNMEGVVFEVEANLTAHAEVANNEFVSYSNALFRDGTIKKQVRLYVPAPHLKIWFIDDAVYVDHTSMSGYNGFREYCEETLLPLFHLYDTGSFDNDVNADFICDADVLFAVPALYEKSVSGTAQIKTLNEDTKQTYETKDKTFILTFSAPREDILERTASAGSVITAETGSTSVFTKNGFTHVDIPTDENGVLTGFFDALGIAPVVPIGNAHPDPGSVSVSVETYEATLGTTYKEYLSTKPGKQTATATDSVAHDEAFFVKRIDHNFNETDAYNYLRTSAVTTETRINLDDSTLWRKYDFKVDPNITAIPKGFTGKRFF